MTFTYKQRMALAFPVASEQIAYNVASNSVANISQEEGYQFYFKQASIDAMSGMSLRDYFAAKAIQGIISREKQPEGCNTYDDLATMAYEMADAMLEAREAK